MTEKMPEKSRSNPSSNSSSNPFWEFSLKLYASPAVQQACLELQDGSGVDVNVLLYMLWQASRGRVLTRAGAMAVLEAVEPWRLDVVVPLRSARRNLKVPPGAVDPKGAEALRAIVKKAELEAERLQQAALHAFDVQSALRSTSATSDLRGTATANVAAYAHALARPLAAAPVGVMLHALEALVPAS